MQRRGAEDEEAEEIEGVSLRNGYWQKWSRLSATRRKRGGRRGRKRRRRRKRMEQLLKKGKGKKCFLRKTFSSLTAACCSLLYSTAEQMCTSGDGKWGNSESTGVDNVGQSMLSVVAHLSREQKAKSRHSSGEKTSSHSIYLFVCVSECDYVQNSSGDGSEEEYY